MPKKQRALSRSKLTVFTTQKVSGGTNEQSMKKSYEARAESDCSSIMVRGNMMAGATERWREHRVFMGKAWNHTQSLTLKQNPHTQKVRGKSGVNE